MNCAQLASLRTRMKYTASRTQQVSEGCLEPSGRSLDSPDRTATGVMNAEALPSTQSEAATVVNFMVVKFGVLWRKEVLELEAFGQVDLLAAAHTFV